MISKLLIFFLFTILIISILNSRIPIILLFRINIGSIIISRSSICRILWTNIFLSCFKLINKVHFQPVLNLVYWIWTCHDFIWSFELRIWRNRTWRCLMRKWIRSESQLFCLLGKKPSNKITFFRFSCFFTILDYVRLFTGSNDRKR